MNKGVEWVNGSTPWPMAYRCTQMGKEMNDEAFTCIHKGYMAGEGKLCNGAIMWPSFALKPSIHGRALSFPRAILSSIMEVWQ